MLETQSKSFKARVVTVSDSRSTGENKDTVGPRLAEILSVAGYETKPPVIVPDELVEISKALIELIDNDGADLVITTGGTGLSPRDVTPEATRLVIEREIPAFGECMRFEGAKHTKFAWLSRGIAGIRNKAIIVNVPGSERGAVQSLESLLPIIHHAIEIVQGEASECGKKLGEED